MTSLMISCDDCARQDSTACDGCLVTAICDREPGDAIVIHVDEVRAMRALGRSGLVPPLRHQLRTEAARRTSSTG